LKVMLIKDVESVGQAGDVKDVADGYGRNYLIPRRLAIVAGKGAEAEARRLREGVAKREAKERRERLEHQAYFASDVQTRARAQAVLFGELR